MKINKTSVASVRLTLGGSGGGDDLAMYRKMQGESAAVIGLLTGFVYGRRNCRGLAW